ncbi:substrate-binding domain-containing protein [Amnibacterium sp. CER49]|uniref:substrate-binding domain-containing protein n=1 Tax=Amnibacterium sp. CER49 TaxID=3039161 RepID=UPI002449F6DB|nr:substrate-binding domain-containing protein [Amnibacterium sp. CER49]MDH2444841.1 substrate-binding domain-containing protein [Amnibacterium sp. CER49]
MRRAITTIAATAAVLTGLVGCTSAGGAGATSASNPAVKKAEAALASLSSGGVQSKGPHGETAAQASSANLTAGDIAAIKAKHASAAIVMHYGGNDWATAQIAGLKSEFARLGIRLVATTDANFKPDLQVSQLQTVMTKKPDIVVSIPTDPVATASAYKAAAAAGAKLVFMGNVPNGMTAGKDYVSDVSADNYGNGVVSAYEMAKAIGGEGKIGAIFHQADFFVTKQRYQGFTDTIKKEFPKIQVVASTGIAGPDFAGQAQVAASAMLTKHPDLKGLWAVWDVPAEGVMAAARAAGNQDLKIATEDLGTNVAIALAKNKLVVGLGAQRPFDQGVTEARLGALALLGKKTPAYVAVPALPVDHSNVLKAWQQVYHAAPPSSVAGSFTK